MGGKDCCCTILFSTIIEIWYVTALRTRDHSVEPAGCEDGMFKTEGDHVTLSVTKLHSNGLNIAVCLAYLLR